MSDAAHSLSDVVATLIAYIGVRLSRQEEDANHPYGHERLECVASLILSLILAGTGIGVGYSGIRKLFLVHETPEIPTLLPLIAAVVSIVVKEGMFRYTCITRVVVCKHNIKYLSEMQFAIYTE